MHRRLCGLIVLCLLAGCGREPREPLFPTDTPSASAEVAGAQATEPSPSAVGKARPVSTRAPGPRTEVPLSLSVELGPTAPRAGQDFTIVLHITNGGTRDADGVDVTTTGPWDRYNVVAIRPVGTFLRYASAWHLISPLAIAPGETATLEMQLRADEPSDEQLSFSVREAGFLVTR